MIAARQIVAALLIGTAVTLVVTLLLGRVWCGWICPLGTVLDGTPRGTSRSATKLTRTPRLRKVKYILLAFILLLALLGNMTLLILDPITLLYRTVTTAFWPALDALITAAETDPLQDSLPPGAGRRVRGRGARRSPAADPTGLRDGRVPALIFVGILALNAGPRPLLVPLPLSTGRAAGLGEQGGAAAPDGRRRVHRMPTLRPRLPDRHDRRARHFESDPSECTMCLDCVPACAAGGQDFTCHDRPPCAAMIPRGGSSSPALEQRP